MAHAVTLAQLQHFQMTQHGLAQRVSAYEPSAHLPLHATLSTTPYLSLLARVQDFGADAGKDAAQWRTVLHAPASPTFALRRCMRGTLHLVPRTLLPEIMSVYGAKAIDVDDEKKSTTTKNKTEDEEDEEGQEGEDEGGEDEEGAQEVEEEVEIKTKFRVLNFYKIPQEEAEEVGMHFLHFPHSPFSFNFYFPVSFSPPFFFLFLLPHFFYITFPFFFCHFYILFYRRANTSSNTQAWTTNKRIYQETYF
jgi:hypothetical protein